MTKTWNMITAAVCIEEEHQLFAMQDNMTIDSS